MGGEKKAHAPPGSYSYPVQGYPPPSGYPPAGYLPPGGYPPAVYPPPPMAYLLLVPILHRLLVDILLPADIHLLRILHRDRWDIFRQLIHQLVILVCSIPMVVIYTYT
ncbi:hypothetical protein V6N13_014068 [Hibiscus sabdariffa]